MVDPISIAIGALIYLLFIVMATIVIYLVHLYPLFVLHSIYIYIYIYLFVISLNKYYYIYIYIY